MPFEVEAFADEEMERGFSEMEQWALNREAKFAWADQLPDYARSLAASGAQAVIGELGETTSALWHDATANFDDVMERAFADCARILVDRARELSEYEFYTLYELRRMGHPYSVLWPPNSAGLPDYVVNLHTGLFHDAWRAYVESEGGEFTITLDNQVPYARFLFTGTKRMRQRPILEAAFEQTEEARAARLQEAVQEADP